MKITLMSVLGLLAGTTLATPFPKSKVISTTIISTTAPAVTLAPGSGGISLCLTFGIKCPKKVTSRDTNTADSELVKRPVGPVCPPGSTYNGHRCVGSKVRRDPEAHFQPVGPKTPAPAVANVVKRDPEPVAEPVFGATPHCSTNKKLCSDVNGKVKREPEPEPQGFPVGPVTAPSSTVPAATPIPSTKTSNHRKHSATPSSIAKREAEANPEPFISIKPSPVGPESVSPPPTTTPKTKKTSKASATAKSDRVVKRDPEADPEPVAIISIRPSPVGPHTAALPTITPKAKTDRIARRDPNAHPEPLAFISILPSPVGPQTAASPTPSLKSAKTHRVAAAAATLSKRDPHPDPNPEPIVPAGPGGQKPHCTANGKICSNAGAAVKRDPEANPEPLAFISILPSPVGPHTAALPTPTPKATKTHKAAAVAAVASTLSKRNPEAQPEPIKPIVPSLLPSGTASKVHCTANGKICSDGTVE